MEFNQLRYACAIAETGSFSRAAEHCNVTQPSLSQQILKLEEDLGVKLFDRLGRSVRLSQAGRAFLPHARSILQQMESARASVADTNAEFHRTVIVGAIPTIAPYLLPNYAALFTKQHPEAKLRVTEDTTPNLVQALRDLSIDIAILALPLRHKDLECFPVRTEPVFAALPSDHSRASAKALSLKSLRGESFVMLRDGHCFRDLSLATCTQARISPNIAFESGQFSSLLRMVAAGLGVSLVPAMAIDPHAGCRYVRLSDARATRTIVATVLRGRSLNQAQRSFVSGLQMSENCRDRP